MGPQKTPTLRGRLDGAPLWPVLVPGTLYAKRFPDRIRQPATADLASLNAFGIPPAVLDAWAGSIAALNDLQLAAINDYGVLDRENLVVTAPTSSAKATISKLAARENAPTRH